MSEDAFRRELAAVSEDLAKLASAVEDLANVVKALAPSAPRGGAALASKAGSAGTKAHRVWSDNR